MIVSNLIEFRVECHLAVAKHSIDNDSRNNV